VSCVTGTNADLDDLLDLATRAARQAGILIKEAPNHALQTATKSSPTDFVTKMDRASEELIRQIILTARPGDGMIGEEGTSKLSHSGVSWLVDPIDGTTNYLRGLPNYSISIAAMSEKETLIGVVYDPTLDETFAAIRGHGVTLNGTPIKCSKTALAESIIATGFSYSSAQRARQAEVLRSVLPSVGDIRRPGSAAVSLCWVACGRLDAFYETGLQPWDYAAGSLIAQEAGVDVHGAERILARSELIIASSPTVTAGLRKILDAATGHSLVHNGALQRDSERGCESNRDSALRGCARSRRSHWASLDLCSAVQVWPPAPNGQLKWPVMNPARTLT
jgi:myo-inositol-1(or 4)-monophosphatase